MTYIPNPKIRTTPQHDQAVVVKTQQISLTSIYGADQYRNLLVRSGSATIGSGLSEIFLSTGNQPFSSATLSTKRRGVYSSGATFDTSIGIRLTPSRSLGSTEMWGYFDDFDGYGFGRDDDGLFTFTRKSGTTSKTYQNSWNVDTLSNSTSSFVTGTVCGVEFAWYGYGSANFYMWEKDESSGRRELKVLHRANPTSGPMIDCPNLPIRAYVFNSSSSGDQSLFVGGRSVSLLGTPSSDYRLPTVFATGSLTSQTNHQAVLAIRKKSTFSNSGLQRNIVQVAMNSINLFTLGAAEYRVLIATGSVAGTFTSPSGTLSSETAVEVATVSSGLVSPTSYYFKALEDFVGGSTNARNSSLLQKRRVRILNLYSEKEKQLFWK